MTDENTYTRRGFLAVSGATAASVATLGQFPRSASADGNYPHYDAQPDHVTLDFPSTMEDYVPRVQTHHLTVQPQGWWGWRATSPEHDTDVYVYFLKFPTQRGFSRWDSHLHDREPFYVFVDGQTGEIEKIIATGYHWFSFTDEDPPTDGTNPRAKPVDPHNHFVLVSEDEEVLLEDIDVNDFRDEFDVWLANGWDESLHPGAARNPWLMESREHWWRDTDWQDSVALMLYRIGKQLGIRDGAESVLTET